jgi:hypothetical protein
MNPTDRAVGVNVRWFQFVRDTTDPALLKAILRVRDGVGGGYWWVECSTCEHGWQVSHYPQPPMRLMPPPK